MARAYLVRESTTIKMSRRKALQLVASGVGTIALAACAPLAPSAGGAPATSSAGGASATPALSSATAQPKYGGTLRYGSDVDINRLDPHFRLSDVYYGIYDR